MKKWIFLGGIIVGIIFLLRMKRGTWTPPTLGVADPDAFVKNPNNTGFLN